MDTSPTSLFDSYEQDYKQLIDGLRIKLEDQDDKENAGMTFTQFILHHWTRL